MEEADALYEVRPEEFVEARTALAKELRRAGRRDDAAAVAKLRRPSVAAWALNQVARQAPDVVEAAVAAGAALRAATDRAVAGDAGELRSATAAERVAANAVVKAAAVHLGARSEALAPALLATIRVAALDGKVADQLQRGVLVTEQAQPGFGFGVELEGTAPAPRARTTPSPKAKAKPTGRAKAAPKVTTSDAAAAKEKADRAAAREAERVRKKELAARQRTADRKQREAARLAKEADEAEAAARDARAAAAEARDAAERALRAVAELAGGS